MKLDIVRFDLGLGIDGDLVSVSISAAQYKAAREKADRDAWIADVADKLRTALAYAATEESYDWDELGADDWPDPAPEACVWEPAPAFMWPDTHPDWPEPPDPGASYEELKRYVNVRFWADGYLQYDQELRVPAELRLTHAEAWALAAKTYDRIHGEATGTG